MATAVAQQLLDALGAAHVSGVVHRDVKPSYVLLGARGRVTLTDFGIASRPTPSPAHDRVVDRVAGLPRAGACGAARHTGVGPVVAGRHPLPRGAGDQPVARDTTAATIWAALHGDVAAPRTRGPWAAAIGGMLQRDPRARAGGPQAAALWRAVGGAAGPQTATTPVTRETVSLTGSSTTRSTWPVVAWAAVAALLLGVAGWATPAHTLFGARAPRRSRCSPTATAARSPARRVQQLPGDVIAPAAGRNIESDSSVACASGTRPSSSPR